MSQKENDKGFYIFAIGSGLMACLGLILAFALTGNWSLLIGFAILIMLFASGISILPRKAFR